ncbi:MAG TPA: SDR family oxidoreductase [Sphingobium sp.]|uniref:SDR family NAD(P)-dependent oxidoreductase n=1 Tax=Sphingobium sp. TaxID=1912891 RepID=UPI002ED59F04
MAVADVSTRTVAEIVSLAGRRAVVTGGAQGLGKAIARRLAEAGASVLIGDVDRDIAQATADDFTHSYGTTVLATYMDVTDSASIVAAADLAVDRLGGLDIWVNNAGVYPSVPILETTDEIWDEVMAVNLRGLFVGSREAARRMIVAGGGGVIVNVASLAGFSGVSPGLAAYATSKHGVRGTTRQMALELAPHDIRVLGVAPSHARTERTAAAIAADPELLAQIPSLSSSRLGRVGVPDDIGRVVLFCASDMAMFMTGSTLLVDAGEMA